MATLPVLGSGVSTPRDTNMIPTGKWSHSPRAFIRACLSICMNYSAIIPVFAFFFHAKMHAKTPNAQRHSGCDPAPVNGFGLLADLA